MTATFFVFCLTVHISFIGVATCGSLKVVVQCPAVKLLVRPWLQHLSLSLMTTTLTACTAISSDQVSAPSENSFVCHFPTSAEVNQCPGTLLVCGLQIHAPCLRLKQTVMDEDKDGNTGGVMLVQSGRR